MASIASGRSGYTAKERNLAKLQAEIACQEEVTKLATTRLALAALEADMISTKGSVRSSTMRSPDIKEPPTKIHKTLVQITGNGGWEPQGDPNPGPDPSDEGEEDKSDSVHLPYISRVRSRTQQRLPQEWRKLCRLYRSSSPFLVQTP